MNTSEIAALTGYSVQQVRDLEAVGAIPPAPRGVNGYRRFSDAHARALEAYRELARAIGPAEARTAMRDIRSVPRADAAALVGSFWVRLHREREQALAARDALRAIDAEGATDAPSTEADAMTITQLSVALGVRPSALRFWERVGLLSPIRVAAYGGTARRYPLAAIREARILVALRSAGYRIPETRRALSAIRELRDAGRSLDALERRVESIADRMASLLRASAVVAEYLELPRAR